MDEKKNEVLDASSSCLPLSARSTSSLSLLHWKQQSEASVSCLNLSYRYISPPLFHCPCRIRCNDSGGAAPALPSRAEPVRDSGFVTDTADYDHPRPLAVDNQRDEAVKTLQKALVENDDSDSALLITEEDCLILRLLSPDQV